MMRNARARKSRGQAMVEGALVLLLFTVLLIGIFDLGQVLFIRQTFVARVRSATRYAVVNPYDETAIRNMVLYGDPAVPGGATSGAFGLTESMVSVARSDVGTSDQRIVVTISGYPQRFFSPWIAGTFSGRAIVASLPLESP